MLSSAVIMIIRSHSARDAASRLTCRCLTETARPETAAPRAAGHQVKTRETTVRSEIKIFCRTDRGASSPQAGPGTTAGWACGFRRHLTTGSRPRGISNAGGHVGAVRGPEGDHG